MNDEGETLKDSIANTCSVSLKISEETLHLIDDNQVDIIKNWLQYNDKYVITLRGTIQINNNKQIKLFRTLTNFKNFLLFSGRSK